MSNVIAVRRVRLALAAIVLALGLSTAPVLLEQAAAAQPPVHSVSSTASTPSIEICNSGDSVYDLKVYDGSYWVAVHHGQCGDWLDTPQLKVVFPGCFSPHYWQVRNRGGDYGRRWDCSTTSSDPGHLSSYIYRTT